MPRGSVFGLLFFSVVINSLERQGLAGQQENLAALLQLAVGSNMHTVLLSAPNSSGWALGTSRDGDNTGLPAKVPNDKLRCLRTLPA